ncbi:MAG: HPr family phosphocarrier protein [Lachnospiraceae bacterium]|nr:HPr family phosphocarrier protein [Lachnospiraceae bacterium]
MIRQKITSNRKSSIGEIIPHIVQTACAYKSAITFEVDEKRVNAKSIMGVMALASQDMLKLQVCADGTDEKEAVAAITELLQ